MWIADAVDILLRLVALASTVVVGLAQFGFVTNEGDTKVIRGIFLGIFVVSFVADTWVVWQQRRNLRYKYARRFFRTFLDYACQQMAENSGNKLRANIMLRQGVFPWSWKLTPVFHSSNMRIKTNGRAKFAKGEGCVGNAWLQDNTLVANLTKPGVRAAFQRGKPTEHKAIMCIPLRIEIEPFSSDVDDGPTIAFLCFNSNSDCADFLLDPARLETADALSLEAGKNLGDIGIRPPWTRGLNSLLY